MKYDKKRMLRKKKKSDTSDSGSLHKIKHFAPPEFHRFLLKLTLPALAAVWLACYVGTGIFAQSIHNREATAFRSDTSMSEYMFNRLNSNYSSNHDGGNPMSYANYQKSVQFYLRSTGTATALYGPATSDAAASGTTASDSAASDAPSPSESVLLDSSEEKLFIVLQWANGTSDSFLSCDAEMDSAYYEFLETYLNSAGEYFFRIPELYINRETWAFIPKKMYLSHDFHEEDSQSIFYENTLPPEEGFELLTTENATVHAYLPGTARNRKRADKKTQDWYDARAAALDDLQSRPSIDPTLSYTTTYVSPHGWFLSNLWFYFSTLLTDSRLENMTPVTLYDENGNLTLYTLLQEHQYSISRMYGTQLLLDWLGATALCLAVCTLLSYLQYSREKNRWERESYRRKLTNALAHDLKSPLMAISGYAENLKENIQPEKSAYYMDEILNCVTYMNNIVADMLDLERLEYSRHTLCTEEIRLENMLEELAARYRTQMDAKKLHFALTGSCVLEGDYKLLCRAFDNLLNNAVIYTPPNNKIQIALSSLECIVTNTGVSLDEDMCRNAFEPFVKEDKARSGQRGSGIGLTIAKQIFDAHNMPCRMESTDSSVSVTVIFKTGK